MTVATIRPNANVAVMLNPTAGQTNWQCVDETPADDADYVSEIDQSTFQDDLYTTPSPSIPVGSTINSVKIYFRVMKNSTKVTTARPRVRALAQAITEGLAVGLTTSWVNKSQTWTTNPVTSAAWTVDEVNDLDIGVSIRTAVAGEASGLCSQLYAEIDYTPPVPAGKMTVQVM